jgi:hypothetical protein
MSNDGDMKVKRSDRAISRLVDGDIVVLVPETPMLHALGGCGIRIWELIEKETSVSDLVDVICDEYEVEPEIARKDIIEFIKELETLKLAEISTETVRGSKNDQQ